MSHVYLCGVKKKSMFWKRYFTRVIRAPLGYRRFASVVSCTNSTYIDIRTGWFTNYDHLWLTFKSNVYSNSFYRKFLMYLNTAFPNDRFVLLFYELCAATLQTFFLFVLKRYAIFHSRLGNFFENTDVSKWKFARFTSGPFKMYSFASKVLGNKPLLCGKHKTTFWDGA